MLIRQLCLGNKLPMHVIEITNFSQQKPLQLRSATANFEDCSDTDIIWFLQKQKRKQESLGFLCNKD